MNTDIKSLRNFDKIPYMYISLTYILQDLDLHIVIRAHKQRPKGYSRGTINTNSLLMHAKEKMQHSFDLQVWDKIR